MQINSPKVITVLGPTASGKTALAVKIARKFNGEVISVDSRQIYKGMDIGTGKDIDEYISKTPSSPHSSSLAKRSLKIPYHLINITTPDKTFSVAEFQSLAYQAINKILKKNKLPILVGGSGLYLEAILNNYQIPPILPSPLIRQQLAKQTLTDLQKKLKQLNPEVYKKIDKKNKRRLIRAIEISKNSPTPNSLYSPNCRNYQFFLLGININKQQLHQKINQRVDKMIKQGLIVETKKLLKKYGAASTPLQTIGYKEIIDHLKNKTPLDETIDLIKLHTRQFAKRQMTWFRGIEKRNSGNKIKWVSDYSEAIKLIHITLKDAENLHRKH